MKNAIFILQRELKNDLDVLTRMKDVREQSRGEYYDVNIQHLENRTTEYRNAINILKNHKDE